MESPVARETVAALYEAAVDEGRWTTALESVARLADAVTAICFLHDVTTNRIIDARSIGGFNPSEVKKYADYYLPLDPARQVLERMPPGTMRPMHHYISDEAVGKSEYFQDFYIPCGHRYSCGGAQLVDGQRAILAVHRAPESKAFDEHVVEQLQQVLNHLPGILRVRALARQANSNMALCASALSALPRPLLVLDRNMVLQYANRAAEAFLREEKSVRCHFGRFATGDASLTHSLAARVSKACMRPPTADVAPLYQLDAFGRATLEFQVVPLPEDLDRTLRPEAMALLSVRRVFRIEGWDKASERPFRLTDAEFRLVVALVEGLTPDEYSVRQGISVNTVRIHIRALLRKTGTRRTAEIVALFAPLDVLKSTSG
jgi:DNA-binding CsgD family transcriptional regulator